MNDLEQNPGRKSLLVTLACFAMLTLAVIAIGTVARWRHSHPVEFRPPVGSNARRSLAPGDPLGPLARGAPFDGWRVIAFHTEQGGRVHVEVAGANNRAVPVLMRPRESLGPPPIADTSRYVISAEDLASGGRPEVVAAARALATTLRSIEENGY